jgi:NAD(P)-dependent dehydrogenase (short-subunit alcohol dehydrogenase family)
VKYDLVDKRCVVTGASAGIGKEVARNLAYFGATVVLACRDRERGSAALQEIVNDSGNERVTMLQVDLSSRTSIRTFVRNVTAGGAPIHVLVNNAAIMSPVRTTSVDGIESTWATNVLGYFATTNLLLPSLRKGAPSRVVHVASTYAGGLQLRDVEFTTRKYDGMEAYRQSKQADRMIAWRLAEICRRDLITVHACHPGNVDTSLLRSGTQGILGRLLGAGRRATHKTPAQGALTPTYVAAAPEVAEQTARFWIDNAPQPCKFAANGEEIAALWRICVEQTGTDA